MPLLPPSVPRPSENGCRFFLYPYRDRQRTDAVSSSIRTVTVRERPAKPETLGSPQQYYPKTSVPDPSAVPGRAASQRTNSDHAKLYRWRPAAGGGSAAPVVSDDVPLFSFRIPSAPSLTVKVRMGIPRSLYALHPLPLRSARKKTKRTHFSPFAAPKTPITRETPSQKWVRCPSTRPSFCNRDHQVFIELFRSLRPILGKNPVHRGGVGPESVCQR